MTSPAIELQAVSKVYRLGLRNRKVRALTDVSLSVAPGEIVGLIGPNGAGKSTTIKIVLNLIQASAGKTFLFGVPVSNAQARTSVGFVPENPAPYEYLTGIEYLRLQGALAGLRPSAIAERIKEVCQLVDLGAMSKTIVRGYSKGMIQRLVIAGALIGRPRLLILDEPTSGLDPLGRKLIRDAILKQRESGTTVLFCTHIISDVEMLCDRFLLMVSGRLVREGKIGSVIEHKASTVEIVVEASPEQLHASLSTLKHPARAVTKTNALIEVSETELTEHLGMLVSAGLRVVRVAPHRYSLEDEFVAAVGQGAVGGQLE